MTTLAKALLCLARLGGMAAACMLTTAAAAQTVRYAYDDAGRMQQVVAPDGKATRYNYDVAGRLESAERELNAREGHPQVLVTHFRYDGADRLIAVAHVRRSNGWQFLLAGQAIARAAGGAITGVDTFRSGIYDAASGQFTGIPDTAQVFEFDGNARLTRERRIHAGSTIDTEYAYDAAGNRVRTSTTSGSGTRITRYTYDTADRLIEQSTLLPDGSTDTVTFGWDANGNLARRTEKNRVTLLRFDPFNRLIDIRRGATAAKAQAAVPLVRYAYDAQGNRVRKWTHEESNYLIDSSWSHAQLLVESNPGGRSIYVRGVDLVRQTVEGGPLLVNLLPLNGHLGSSIGAVDLNGDVVETVDVDAFGNLLQTDAPKQTHLFAGEYWDQDSQLVYLRARWYDPSVGRFISADPFEGRQAEPRSLNRYVYAHSDPVHGTDPSGEMTLGETNATANVQGTLTTVGQQSLQTQIRKVMLGNPKQGDFGILGNLILEEMLGAVGDVLENKTMASKSGQVKGTQAHKLLEERMKQLNEWIKGIPMARDIDIKAELFLLPDGSKSTPGVKGAMGLDVVLIYRGKKFAAFDLKMGGSNISNKKYFEYQRRFGARLFLIRFK